MLHGVVWFNFTANRYSRTFWRIVVIGLILCFVLAFLIAITKGEPPLPNAQVTASTSVEGKLLSHVDRFWYVFEQGTLLALPDEEVTEVQIYAQYECVRFEADVQAEVLQDRVLNVPYTKTFDYVRQGYDCHLRTPTDAPRED